MLNDSAYNTNQQRLNGVQSGIASSQLQNKFQYQVSLVAYAIASIMYNNGMDANDADAVSAFVSNMSNTLVQKVLDKASTKEAQAGTVDTKWMSPSLVKAAIDFTLSHDLTISGNTTFSGTVSGPTPTLDSHLATKEYVDSGFNQWKVEKVFEVSRNKVYSTVGEYIVADRESLPTFDPGLYFMKIDYNVTNSGDRAGYINIVSGNYEIGRELNRNNVLEITRTNYTTPIAGTIYINTTSIYNNNSFNTGIFKNVSLSYIADINNIVNLYSTNSYICIVTYIQSGVSITCNLTISYYRITSNL